MSLPKASHFIYFVTSSSVCFFVVVIQSQPTIAPFASCYLPFVPASFLFFFPRKRLQRAIGPPQINGKKNLERAGERLLNDEETFSVAPSNTNYILRLFTVSLHFLHANISLFDDGEIICECAFYTELFQILQVHDGPERNKREVCNRCLQKFPNFSFLLFRQTSI